MKTKMIMNPLILAVAVAASTAATADYGSPRYDAPRYDIPRPAQPVPPANVIVVPAPAPAPAPVIAPLPPMPPAFQETLRMMNEIDERQDRQLDRILDGLYERRISPVEFRRLMDEQRAIRAMERQFLADGLLTRFEYQKLDAALDAARRSIFKEASDGPGRPGYGYYGGGWNEGYGGYKPWNR